MKRTHTTALVLALAATLVAGVPPPPAQACASVTRSGAAVPIAAEEAIVVWDPVRRVEHFIRRGDFDTSEPDFGFLVPTPAVPTLTAANEAAFGRLTRAITPPVRHRKTWSIGPPFCLGMFLLRGAAPTAIGAPPLVRVLSESRVAGFDTAVLAADDATALAAWLGAHGYPSRPALTRWLEPIIAAHWTLTAFKVARAPHREGPVGLSAVRLTFAADAPFYPYREPDDARETPGRSLRLFVVTPGRISGTLGLGSGSADGSRPWPATLEYARPLHDPARTLAGAVPAELLPAHPWLSAFLDRVPRRPAADLFFHEIAERSQIRPPPTVIDHETEVPFPAELLLLLTAMLWWRRRRRRAVRG